MGKYLAAIRTIMTGLVFGLMLLPAAQAGGLTDMTGKARSLDDYVGNGKWTVVMIWASDCHICNKEAYQYVDFHTFHKDKDAQVLGISMDGADGAADAEKFIERHSVNFPNLIGEPQEVARLFTGASGQQLQGTPTFMVFDPQGKLRAADAGAIPAEVISEFIASNTKS